MSRGIEVMSPASYLQTSNWLFQESRGTKWTAEENKTFENALALYDKDTPDRWFQVAAMIPGKTVGDVIKQYRELEEDVSDIEAGLIPIPGYASDSFTLDWGGADAAAGNNGFNVNGYYFAAGKRGSGGRPPEQERKKGVPWTEEEHRQFLMGLKKYGKGDWRNIARNFVTTRTPTQVASHAQKYFIRQLTGGKDKRRSSIHDITTINVPDSPDAAAAVVLAANANSNANAPNSPSSAAAEQRQRQAAESEADAYAVFDQNAFSDAFLGMTSSPYMTKLQEQSVYNASQFSGYNAFLQM